MPYEKNGFQRPCNDDCLNCRDKDSCENYDEGVDNSSSFKEDQIKIIPEVKEQVLSYEEKIRIFVLKKTNELIDKYYRLSYDKRKLVKYVYNEQYNWGYFRNSQDNFYISGSIATKNLETRWSELKEEKKESIKNFIRDVEIYGVADFLGMFYLDEDSSRFSTNAAAHIDYRVKRKRLTDRWGYFISEKLIDSKTCEKKEVREEYKKYIETKYKNENK